MSRTFAASLDELGQWRSALAERLATFSRFLAEHSLVDEAAADQLEALRQRVHGEKLVVAFVAEFSRGKSELINAIFFADAGKRVLPATPGRTTMCPVELAWDAEEEPSLLLLPIATRLEGHSLNDLRQQPRAWTKRALAVDTPAELAEALTEVTRTTRVALEQARALGFWDDERPDDNPPLGDDDLVEVPAWRHAVINYPHPLLKQGLVVLDTPGLNAIGAEPELTLSLLPSAHATVFVLGADTGVTRSDLAIWRDHLASGSRGRFVVLNKIDALVDPLASAEEVDAQIELQRQTTAQTLALPPARVFPLSARQALAARVSGDADGFVRSRLAALEDALAEELLPARREVLVHDVSDAVRAVEGQVLRRLGDDRRQLAEQMLELRGLRGKSAAKVRLLLQRLAEEAADFERCTTQLQALRVVHTRMLKDAMVGLSSDRLREEVSRMQDEMSASILKLGAKKAFVGLCTRLRALLTAAERQAQEIREMLAASFSKLNADYGFSLSLPEGPALARFGQELTLIESSYVQYLGLTHALRLSQPKFMEQFRRMLVSKLRVVFENASGELEVWSKGASGQVDTQLRERRRGFRRRREALERIQAAAGELEHRISELEAQDQRLSLYVSRTGQFATMLRRPEQWAETDSPPASLDATVSAAAPAAREPTLREDGLLALDLPPDDEAPPMLLRHAQA